MNIPHLIKSFANVFMELGTAMIGSGYSSDNVDNIPLPVAIITSIIALAAIALIAIIAFAYLSS